jgi:hypothetical protein
MIFTQNGEKSNYWSINQKVHFKGNLTSWIRARVGEPCVGLTVVSKIALKIRWLIFDGLCLFFYIYFFEYNAG